MKKTLPCLVLGCLAACSAPSVGIQARYGSVNVDGDVGISSGSVSANNSADAFGIKDDEGVVSVRGDFKWGLPHLSVTLQQSAHDGTGMLEAEISEGGITIPAGTQVDTKMDLGLHSAYLTFDLVPGPGELGLGVGVIALDLNLKTSDGLGNSVSADELIPIPVAAARAGVSVWRIDFEALAGGMAWQVADDDVTFFDLDLNASLLLLGDENSSTGWLTLGLRHTDIDANYRDGSAHAAANLQFSGPYVGLRLVF